MLHRVFRARGRGPSYAGVFSTLGGWVLLAVMFRPDLQQRETNGALDAVISALVTAYRDAGIEMPAEIRQLELGPTAAGIAVRPAGGGGRDRRGDERA